MSDIDKLGIRRMRSKLTVSKLLLFAFSFSSLNYFGQVTLSSTQDGDWEDASTWGGSVPSSSDNVVIKDSVYVISDLSINNVSVNNGGYLDLSKELEVDNDLSIFSGGTVYNSDDIIIKGDYLIDGIHAGNSLIIFDGSGGSISGNGGKFTNSNEVRFLTSDRTIASGSVINFGSMKVKLEDEISIFNNGEVKARLIEGKGKETWVNEEGSMLRAGQLKTSIDIDASADDNHVYYQHNGNITTNILAPTTGEYYDISIIGNGIKKLKGSITVNNDLVLGGTADLKADKDEYDITIKGDWLNQGGDFLPAKASVIFSGTDQLVDGGTNGQDFYDLIFSNSDTLTQENDLSVQNDLTFSSTFNLNGQVIYIGGDFTNNGTFIHGDGTVEMNGSNEQSISNSTSFGNLNINGDDNISLDSGTIDVIGTLSLLNGTLVTNDNLIIGSTATETGSIGPVTDGTISGEVTVQRHFDPVWQGWHQLGVATSGGDLSDWDDDFVTTGFTGSDFPDFPFINILSYDETIPGQKNNGLVEATNITENIAIGSGRRVYLDNEPMLIETKGNIHTGNFNYSISYTPSFGSSDDGWNLISNPYASAIDWDGSGWTKTSVNDAIYIWDGDLGLYNSYIAGVSTNGGSNIIPSSQAFWIQTNAASPVLTITESDKSSSQGTFKNLNDLQVFNIYIELSGFEDQIAIVVRDEATMNFDPAWDAYKFYTDTGIPNIASVAEDSTELSINSIPTFNEDISIPLKVVANEGTYNIRTFEDQVLLGTSCATLEDLATGDMIPVTANLIHSFDWSDTLMIEPRFLLHFTAPADLNITHETCPVSNNGSVSVMGTGTGPWDYTWYDLDNVVLGSQMSSMTSAELSDLEPGIYSVEINGGNSCGNDIIEFEVLPAQVTNASVVNISVDECNSSNNGMIEVDLQHNDEDMIWDLELNDSDGNELNSVTAATGTTFFNDLSADVYTITITNDCENIALEVDIMDENVVLSSFDAVNPVVNIAVGEELELINTSPPSYSFHWDLGDGNTSTDYSPTHMYSAPGFYMVTLTVTNDLCTDESSMLIEVIDQVSGITSISDEDVEIYLDQNENIVIATKNEFSSSLTIEFNSYSGQLIYQKVLDNISGQILIPNPDVAGSVYVISGMVDGKQVFSKRLKL